MLRAVYDWTIRLADHPKSLWALAIVAFIESSVFPIPPDILMIPMIIAAPHKAFRIALIATIASVLGGIFGYAIGALLFEQIGLPVLNFYGKAGEFETFRQTYNDWGAWAVLIAGVTPFPYKVITILSGSTGLNIWVFTLASIVARGLRFYVVAALLWKFGDPVRDFIEKRLGLMFTLFIGLLLGGFLVLRYV